MNHPEKIVDSPIGKLRIVVSNMDHAYVSNMDDVVINGVTYGSASVHLFRSNGVWSNRSKNEGNILYQPYLSRKYEFNKDASPASKSKFLVTAIQTVSAMDSSVFIEGERSHLYDEATRASEAYKKAEAELEKARLALVKANDAVLAFGIEHPDPNP